MWPRRLASILGLAAFTFLALQIQTPAAPDSWAPWSAAAVAQARGAGHPVLVDFSAAWCVTCLVNERVALADEAVLGRFRRDGVVLLKADWTNRGTEISAELDRHGRGGVPLYLLYRAGMQGEAEVLPQILTPSVILAALGRARVAGAERRLPNEP
jgi:thiol:disulfide interchange protein DsbD